MEPGNNETGGMPQKKDSQERTTEGLATRIVTGIKARLLSEAAVTYHDRGDNTLARASFLTTADGGKSVGIFYRLVDNSDPANAIWDMQVRSIDNTGIHPTGYELSLGPSTEESWIEFVPGMASPWEKTQDIFEAAFGLVPQQYYDTKHRKRHEVEHIHDDEYEGEENGDLQEGLLTIAELLEQASPDEKKTEAAKEWLTDQRIIHEHDEILTTTTNALSHVDSSLTNLKRVVQEVSASGNANPAN